MGIRASCSSTTPSNLLSNIWPRQQEEKFVGSGANLDQICSPTGSTLERPLSPGANTGRTATTRSIRGAEPRQPPWDNIPVDVYNGLFHDKIGRFGYVKVPKSLFPTGPALTGSLLASPGISSRAKSHTAALTFVLANPTRRACSAPVVLPVNLSILWSKCNWTSPSSQEISPLDQCRPQQLSRGSRRASGLVRDLPCPQTAVFLLSAGANIHV